MTSKETLYSVWECEICEIKSASTRAVFEEQMINFINQHPAIKEFVFIRHDAYKNAEISDEYGQPVCYRIILKFSEAQEQSKLCKYFGVSAECFRQINGSNAFYDSLYDLTLDSKNENAKGKYIYSCETFVYDFRHYKVFADMLSGYLFFDYYAKSN